MPRVAVQIAAKIDRERRALELQGQRAAALIGSRARRYAITALRSGNDPALAVRNVIRGNDRIGQPGIVPLIRDAMIAAHLTGRRRTEIQVAPQFRARDRVKLAGTVYDDALDWLRKRLNLTVFDLELLQQVYEAEALRVVANAAASLEQVIQETIVQTTAEGLGVRDGVKALRQAFESEGFAPEAPHRLETIFRTQTQMAYGAGRWNSQQDEAIQEILWGFEYVTVGDDRVRPAHAAMDGVKRPKDDPIWQAWTPPCGWNCRCSVIEIWQDESPEATNVPDVQPDPGWSFNPGQVFRDGLPRAA
jgi:SPP1 gp7 family putative phage head morphogenesis protein